MALVAHPDDDRYKALFGHDVITPLFGVRVPVLAHPLADPEKGSGVAMICTFGDTTDVTWWRELSLPTRPSSVATDACAPCRGATQSGPPRTPRRRHGPTASSKAAPSRRPGPESSRCSPSQASSSASPSRSDTRSSSTSGATDRSRSCPAASGTCKRS